MFASNHQTKLMMQLYATERE